MNSAFKHINRNKEIYAIILLFLAIMLAMLFKYKTVWWDSSVYIGMGKYIFSFGKSGLWEESRPLILPFTLGLGWKLGFNAVYFGRFVSIILAIFIVVTVYKIGIKLFSKKTGLLAAFFTAFSSTFLFFSSNILTEIPAALFMLLAFYFFLNGRYFFMGFFSGIAVMTRFFQIFVLLGLYASFLIYLYKKPNFYKKLIHSIAGFLLVTAPYALFNYYWYNDLLLPFKVQLHLTKTTGWMLYEDFGFYFRGLFEENFFILILLASPIFLKKNRIFSILAPVSLVYILIFSFVKHKEMRFMLVILPFLYLLLAYCLEQVYNKLHNKRLCIRFFYAALIFWALMAFIELKGAVSNQEEDQGLLYFQNYLTKNSGNIWLTSPLYALQSNQRIGGLLYFYSSPNLMDFINSNKHNADIALFNDCDISCAPIELDPLCPKSRKVLESALSNLEIVYEKQINSCKYRIYRKPIS